MAIEDSWKKLLREVLAALALPQAEQVRANGPGCVTCDLIEDFEFGCRMARANGAAELTQEQKSHLDDLATAVTAMAPDDCVCFDEAMLSRPAWEELRILARTALASFGWSADLAPFVEVTPGVWRRSE